MKKILYFVMLFLYLLGVLGGIGYAAYNKAYVIVVGIIATGYMAYPKAKEYFKLLTD